MNIDSKFKYSCLLLCILLLLSACASKPVKPVPPGSLHARQSALAEIDRWQLRARIGLRSSARSGSATLLWNEQPEQRSLRLLGPLGGGLILLQQDASGVSVQDGKGDTWHAEDAGELIFQVTGWQIPVSGLRWWILGMTEPGSHAKFTVDASQRLASVQQDGWKVTFARYALFGDYELPSSLVVETEAGLDDENGIRVKLIVKEWKFETKD